METNAPIRKVELHIVVGCADARDISSAFNEAVRAQVEEERAKGTLIDFQRMSVAGTFMTSEIIAEVKRLISEKLRDYYQYYKEKDPIEIFVHVTSHGNAVLKEGHSLRTRSYHDIQIHDSPFNCGMLHANEVAVEMEEVLMKDRAVLEYGIGSRTQLQIMTEEDIEKLLWLAYAHNGTIAGNWVKSIGNLATHPYEQKKVLRNAIDSDPALSNMRVHITAGVQNYAMNEYYRVDGNVELTTFLDRVYERVRKTGSTDQAVRTAKQKPVLGLFHHTSVQQARATAVKYCFSDPKYSGGQVFAIGSINLPDYFRTFGPYKSAGFFYGVVHLGLKKWVVMGRDAKETETMVERIKNDPLMGYFVKKYGVSLVPITADGEKLPA